VGEISTIGLDIAKQVFHAHGADSLGGARQRRRSHSFSRESLNLQRLVRVPLIAQAESL
jgi:transposase